MNWHLKKIILRNAEKKILAYAPVIFFLLVVVTAFAKNYSGNFTDITKTDFESNSVIPQYKYVSFRPDAFYDTQIKVRSRESGDYTFFYGIAAIGNKYFFAKLPYYFSGKNLTGKKLVGHPVFYSEMSDWLPENDKKIFFKNENGYLCIEVSDISLVTEKSIFIASVILLLIYTAVLIYKICCSVFFKSYFFGCRIGKKDKINVDFELNPENACIYAKGDNFLFMKDFLIWEDEKNKIRCRCAEDLVWVYAEEVNSNIFGLKKCSKVFLKMNFTDGKSSLLHVEGKEYAENLLMWFYQRYQLISGYDEIVNNLYTKDPLKLKKLVY